MMKSIGKRKIMYQKLFVEGMNLAYTLYEEIGQGRRVYSIMCEHENEAALLPDVSSDIDEAKRIFELFVRGTVTPVSAFYVVEEILSGGVIY